MIRILARTGTDVEYQCKLNAILGLNIFILHGLEGQSENVYQSIRHPRDCMTGMAINQIIVLTKSKDTA